MSNRITYIILKEFSPLDSSMGIFILLSNVFILQWLIHYLCGFYVKHLEKNTFL